MGYKFNPLTFIGLDIAGSGDAGSSSFRDPVADEASLPSSGNNDGDTRVTLDTGTIYVWDDGISRWINNGTVEIADVGSTPSSSGYSIANDDATANVRNKQLVLQPADGSNPGVITAGAQTIGGAKSFSSAVTIQGSEATTTDNTQTLTNKTIDADNNIITNIGNDELSSGISATKIADGSVTDAEFQYINTLTSNAQDQLDAKADLVGGKIPSSQIPAIAITDVFVVADIAARDALTIGSADGEIQEGDVVIVTDASADPAITSGSASYIYDSSTYQLLKSGDEVLSVNGQTGSVVLDADDIDDTLTTNKFATQTQLDKVDFITVTQAVDLDTIESDTATNNAKVSADGSVTTHNDVTDAGSGQIITDAERTDLNANTAARHDAVTLNADDPTQQTLNLSGQEIQVNLATTSTDGAMSAEDKTKLDTIVGGSAGDVSEQSASFLESQTNTTIFTLDASVRSADILISVFIDATTDIADVYRITTIYDGTDHTYLVTSSDNTDVIINVTSGGAVQYTSTTYAGFSSGTIKYRVMSTTI